MSGSELLMEMVLVNSKVDPAARVRVESTPAPGGPVYRVSINGAEVRDRGLGSSTSRDMALRNAFSLAELSDDVLREIYFRAAAQQFLQECVQVLGDFAEDPARNIDANCHHGITDVTGCGRCGRSARAFTLRERIKGLLGLRR